MPDSILSIQSHVAYGHVGNRAAVFPLQRLGHEVWAIHTEQFSNHTGYGDWKGAVFPASHIRELVAGIAARGVLGQCAALLSGYMGDPETGAAILEALDAVAAARGKPPFFCCDPVMGDVGRGFFVRPGIPDYIRDTVMPRATILTPNQFELGFLSELQIASLGDCLAACARLREQGPSAVLVTSLEHEATPADRIQMLLDTAEGSWVAESPKIALEPAPNGAGDCTAALFLSHHLAERSAAEALRRTMAGIYAVFEATARAGSRELSLITAQDRLDGVENSAIKVTQLR